MSKLVVLFPVDKSWKKSARVLPLLKKLQKSCRCEIHAVFIVDPTLEQKSPELESEALRLAEEAWRRIKAELNGCTSWSVRRGEPVGEIIAHAKEVDADLIIMPTSGLCRTLLHSVTERVVRLSGRPVLTVYVPEG